MEWTTAKKLCFTAIPIHWRRWLVKTWQSQENERYEINRVNFLDREYHQRSWIGIFRR